MAMGLSDSYWLYEKVIVDRDMGVIYLRTLIKLAENCT